MAKHLEVELILDPISESHANIEIDDARQVIMNLVGNAITAAKESLTPRPPKVTVCLQEQDDCATLLVSDNGDGPPREIADQIFEPFVSGSKSGTGLGLVQVAEIADQIGGKVSWQRHDGLTVFEFRFAVTAPTTAVEATE